MSNYPLFSVDNVFASDKNKETLKHFDKKRTSGKPTKTKKTQWSMEMEPNFLIHNPMDKKIPRLKTLRENFDLANNVEHYQTPPKKSKTRWSTFKSYIPFSNKKTESKKGGSRSTPKLKKRKARGTRKNKAKK